jgi:hypothetical protein
MPLLKWMRTVWTSWSDGSLEREDGAILTADAMLVR